MSIWQWKVTHISVLQHTCCTCATTIQLFGLPFAPLENVNEIFEYLVENTEENSDDLMDYVFRMYVHGRCGRGRRPEAPRFSPETWNVFTSVLNGNHRVNNAVEGWHSKFQKLVVVHYPSIWRFIEVLKDE